MANSFLLLIGVTVGLAFGQASTCLCHPAIPAIPPPRFGMLSSSPGNFPAAISEVARDEGKSACTEITADTSNGPFHRRMRIAGQPKGLMLADLLPEATAEGISVVNGDKFIAFQSEGVTNLLHNPLNYTIPSFSYEGDHRGLIEKLAKIFYEERVWLFLPGQPDALLESVHYSVAFDKPVTLRDILLKITENSGVSWEAIIQPDQLPDPSAHRTMALGFSSSP